jgi:hypothetical protein
MSIQLTKIGNSPNVPTKDFVCDTLADVEKLPNAPMGSTAFCLEDKSAYMKGSEGWVKL